MYYYSPCTRYRLASSFSYLFWITTCTPTATTFIHRCFPAECAPTRSKSLTVYKCCRQVGGIHSADDKPVEIDVFMMQFTSLNSFWEINHHLYFETAQFISRLKPRCVLRRYNVNDHVNRLVLSSCYQFLHTKSIRHARPTTSVIQLMNSVIVSRVGFRNSVLTRLSIVSTRSAVFYCERDGDADFRLQQMRSQHHF